MINKIISTTAVVIAVSVGIYSYLQDIETSQKMQKFMSTGPRYTSQDGNMDREQRKQADQALCERIAKLERSIAGKMPFYDLHPPCGYYEWDAQQTPPSLKTAP